MEYSATIAMGSGRKVDDFDRWSRDRGLVARDVDRRRVAGELFDLAGADSVAEDHVDELIKRYREGLMGAHGILQARRVAEELLSWQAEAKSPEATSEPAEPEPRRGIESEGASADLAPGVNLRKVARGALGAPRMPADASGLLRAARGRGFSHQPEPDLPSQKVPEKRSVRPSFSEEVRKRTDRPDRRQDNDAGIRGRERPGHSVQPTLTEPGLGSSPPLRPATMSPAISERVDPISDAPAPPRSVSARVEQQRSELPVERSASSRPASPRPSSSPPASDAAARYSNRPQTSQRGVDKALLQSSSPPIRGGILDIDDEPKRFDTGRDRPASVHPVDAAGLPEVEISDEGTDHQRRQAHDVLTESVAPPPPPKPPGLPLVITRAEVETNATRWLIGGIGVLLVAVAVYVFVSKPIWLFGAGKAPVQGAYVSPQLGVALQFREPWLYAKNLDSSKVIAGWTRRESMFFKDGAEFESAGTKLTLVVFSAKDRIAAETDALQLGGAELQSVVSQRSCKPVVFSGMKGTECLGLASRPGQSFGLVESYFPQDGKVVFARAEVVLSDYQRALASPDQRPPSFEPELLEKYVAAEDVVKSLQPVVSAPAPK